jgi:hemoglobin
LLTAGLVALSLTAQGRPADEKGTAPLDRKALDSVVYKTLRTVINQGADLYNSGDVAGCYRLYEGSLVTVRPLLDHRPELQEAISKALLVAERNPMATRRAFDLREALDKVRTEVNPNPRTAGGAPPTETNQPPRVTTLWDRLGGEEGVTQIVDDFTAKAVSDPRVNLTRNDRFKQTPESLKKVKRTAVEFFSSETGGPLKYLGKNMKEAHAGMEITSEEFDAFAENFRDALVKNKVKPADVQAFMEKLNSYRKDIVEAKAPVVSKPMSLWERLGGEAGVTKVVDQFVAKATANPAVDFSRDGRFKPSPDDVKKIKRQLVAMISEASGGPLKYEGKSMKEAHKGMGITAAQFDALAKDLKDVLESNAVKAADIKDIMDAVGKTRADIVETKPVDKKGDGPKETVKKEDSKKPEQTAKLSGKITYKGKPLTEGNIVLVGSDGKSTKAAISAEGTYAAEGLKPGQYTITVQGTKDTKHPVAPAKYSDEATSGLKVIALTGVNPLDIELQD